jgi:ribose transport system substrate-binding protein
MRTYRSFGVMAMAVLLAVSFAAPAAAQSDETKLKIGYAPSTYDFTDFFGQFDAGLRAGLNELIGDYEYFVDAPQDEREVEQQRNIIENMLALGVDYLVAVPTRLEVHYESFRLVNEAGVPLIIGQYVVPIPEEEGIEVLSYPGVSNENAGELAAQYIIDTVGEDGKIVILSGFAGHVVDEGRVSHAIPILEAAGVEVLAREYVDFQRDLAFNATEALLTKFPDDLDLIYGGSSAMAAGAIGAVEAAGRDVPVIGIGGVLEEVLGVLDGSQLATVYRDPAAMGRAAAEAIFLHNAGRADEIQYVVELDHKVLDSCEDVVANYNRLLFDVAGEEWPTC